MLEIWESLGAARCVVCDAASTARPRGIGGRVCSKCFQDIPDRVSRLPVAPVGVDAAWSLGAYSGVLGALVRAGKFKGDEGSLRDLAAHMAEGLPLLAVDVVVAVPSSPWRRMWRGVNPADLLAEPIAESLGVPQRWPLTRVRSHAQARLGHADRSANVREAYRARASVAGTVLLVDDVVTTGSTATSCARALAAAGADRVFLLTVAAAASGIARG